LLFKKKSVINVNGEIASLILELEIDRYIWPILGFYRYIGIGQNRRFYRPR